MHIAVLKGVGHLLITGFLIMGILCRYGTYRASLRAFQALPALIMQTVSMDILQPLTVGRELQIDDKTA